MPVAELSPGTQLSKYRIAGLLGRGGMSVVYAGLDTTLQRPVAIKVLTSEAVEDQTDLKRFLLEARAAARLNHPNVVTVHDVRHNEQGFFIVMELVEGKSADAWLKANGKMPWDMATRIVADACRGLASAHAAGLIHRDVKPSNLLLTKDGVAKLADFGLTEATHLHTGAKNHCGTVMGTPHFMSPEQCGGETLDERADVYSLGATYYTLLAGRPPYDAADPALIMYAHCASALSDVRAAASDVPAACAQIIERAMAKSRLERFASATEMLAALQAALKGDTPSEAPPLAPAPWKLRVPSVPLFDARRFAPWIAVAILLIVGVWLGWTTAAGQKRPGQGVPMPHYTADPQMQLTLRPQQNAAITHQAAARAVCLAEDYVVSGGADRQIHVASRVTGAVRHTMHHNVPVDTVAISPDGKIIAAAGRTSSTVSLWEAETGGSFGLIHAAANVCCLAFAPSGDQLAVASETELQLYNYRRATKFLPGPKLLTQQYVVSVVAYSADDRHLVACTDNGDAYVWSLPAFQKTTIPTKFPGRITTACISHDGSQIAFGSHDGTAYLWNADQGPPKMWKENLKCILSSAFDPQLGSVVFVGEWGGPLRVCDLISGKTRSIPTGIDGAAMGVAFAPDGRTLAAAGADGSVRLWDVLHIKRDE